MSRLFAAFIFFEFSLRCLNCSSFAAGPQTTLVHQWGLSKAILSHDGKWYLTVEVPAPPIGLFANVNNGHARMYIWDVPARTKQFLAETAAMNSAVFASDSRKLATVHLSEHCIRIWSQSTKAGWELANVLTIKEHDGFDIVPAFCEEGNRLLVPITTPVVSSGTVSTKSQAEQELGYPDFLFFDRGGNIMGGAADSNRATLWSHAEAVK